MVDYEFNIFSYIINWMGSDKMSNEKGLLERLAELAHEQWVEWSKSIAESIQRLIDLNRTGGLNIDAVRLLTNELGRLERWEKLWIPYNELSEEMKEEDRKYARKVLKELQK